MSPLLLLHRIFSLECKTGKLGEKKIDGSNALGIEEPFFYLANEWHKLHAESAQNMADVA